MNQTWRGQGVTTVHQFRSAAYTDRQTAGTLILKLFPELMEDNGREVAAPYIKLTLAHSDEAVIPGETLHRGG